MASKDNINSSEWGIWHGDVDRKRDDLSENFPKREISSSIDYEGGEGPERVWQDLRAAQDSGTKLSTDIDLLRKGMADLKEKNAMMYKALMSLQSDNKQLRQDVRALQEQGHDTQEHSDQHSLDYLHTKTDPTQIAALKKDISRLEQDIESLHTETAALSADVSVVKTGTETGSSTLLSQRVGKVEKQMSE